MGFAVVVGALVVEEEGALVVVGEGEGGGGIQASERMITRDRVRKYMLVTDQVSILEVKCFCVKRLWSEVKICYK